MGLPVGWPWQLSFIDIARQPKLPSTKTCARAAQTIPSENFWAMSVANSAFAEVSVSSFSEASEVNLGSGWGHARYRRSIAR